MQRIFNFHDWYTLVEGQQAMLGGSEPRAVRLEVNAEDVSKLYVVDQNGDEHFLARVVGRDEVQFSVDGPFHLLVMGGTVNFKTAETADWTVEPVDDTTYTTIVERRSRNPELEQMMYNAQINMERRLNAQQEEFARRLETRIAERNVGAAADTAIGDDAIPTGPSAGSGSATSGQAGAGDEPGTPTAPAAPAGTTENG